MKKLISEFGGVIFFYLAIVGTVLAVNYRFEELNEMNNEEAIAYVINE